MHDSSDSTFITRRVLWLFRRASIVFKRELPIDRWQVFTHTIHPDLPTGRFRRIAAYRDIIAKMHPISLGFRVGHEKLFPSGPVEKTRDIFFAGTGSFSSFVRERGSEEIRALIASGLDVDAPEGFLPREEFYRRCAQARLVWSPHGFGHDCFRHYEAAALGSVPLINRPPIEQYERFTDGVNCFFYDPEPGGLTQAIQRALGAARRACRDGGGGARALPRPPQRQGARRSHADKGGHNAPRCSTRRGRRGSGMNAANGRG